MSLASAVAGEARRRPQRAALRVAAEAPLDAEEAAELAGLHYVSDREPGLRRIRSGRGFGYLRPDGGRVDDPKILDRIRKLVIPPAWEKVWICRFRNGHIQATGRDAKGRKQYIYHPEFRELRERSKYDQLLAFASALPTIRARVDEHLRLPGLPREKVLATIVHLLDTTFIRVGNEEYARENKSFGLTTLKNRHAVVDGSEISFQFKGKHGVDWSVSQRDRRIARIIRSCQELPGQHLFQYLDDAGSRVRVTSTDVNAYLREISGIDVSAKDFRTWGGTVLAAAQLSLLPPFASKKEAEKNIRLAVAAVAARLGNTQRVCRQCYIHPVVVERYGAGALAIPEAERDWLSAAEIAVLRLLEAGVATALRSAA
jgi:DNA topoisomerase-1